MRTNRPPYIGQVRIQDWITKDKKRIPGIRINGASGMAGHLSADEARSLADKLHDLADKLSEPPQERQQTPCGQSPLYTSQTLTAADGTEEQPLPATPAD